MKVDTGKPFQVVYTIYQHQLLGFLVEAFAVQEDSKGRLSMVHQSVSPRNIEEFDASITAEDYKLVKLIEECSQEAVCRKFATKKISVRDFFLKTFDAAKGDKLLQEEIEKYIERRKAEIFKLLVGKKVFNTQTEGGPATDDLISVVEEPAKITFFFDRDKERTWYSIYLSLGTERLTLYNKKQSCLLCNQPGYVLVENRIISLEEGIDGAKIKPFLTRRQIEIKKDVEEKYFQNFIKNLVAADYRVEARGFEILVEECQPEALLIMNELKESKSLKLQFAEAGETEGEETENPQEQTRLHFKVLFRYGKKEYELPFAQPLQVHLEKTEDSYTFLKVYRNMKWERSVCEEIETLGLKLSQGRGNFTRSEGLRWLHIYQQQEKQPARLIQQLTSGDGNRYFIGEISMSVKIEENRDWFDIQARVKFGEYTIPFLKVRSYILNDVREFKLPNGEIAIIPDSWFTQYKELFAFAKEQKDTGESLVLSHHHLGIVQEMQTEQLAQVTISRKLERLRDFKEIETIPLPEIFKGELRKYQQSGFEWMAFLNKYKFGGCLADDMGLGKTVQTLALLSLEKERQKESGIHIPTLLVAPTSLIYNWALEAKKFAPAIKILNHTGTQRERDAYFFPSYDVIMTSYGTLRSDIEIFSGFEFNYIILDESQAIKNPTSIISKAVMRLRSKQRLILTGTPLENTTLDLWSQMNFINPGLLGSLNFFKNEYQQPIERKQDAEKLKKLHSIIKPFILRRNKSQVATDLPPKVESIHYSSMSEEQEKAYEAAKNYYRNQIIEHIERQGIAKSQLYVLQGLSKLRQLANHPAMVDESYEGNSGKMEDMLYKLQDIVKEGHKVLIFSQYVKHLSIVRSELDARKITYAYLDGTTRDRAGEVKLFQENDNIKVFLISLKAGGVGLNLTAAEYVFILDPWWNPAIEAQAVDRAHRIGQQKSVFTYKFITKGTVEEKILLLQQGKQKLMSDLIISEESFMKSLSEEDILKLLQ